MAAISSNGTGGGNWSSTASWTGGVVPGDGDNVTIASGDTITVDQNIVIGDDTGTCLTVNGIFDVPYTIGANYTLTMKGNYAGSGEWKIGSSVNPLASSSSYIIKINAYNGTPSARKYSLTVPSNGTLSWYGANKTTDTTLNGQALSGQANVTFVNVTGWVVGDIIVLVDETNDANTEELVISSISVNTVTFTTNLITTKNNGWFAMNMSTNIRVENFSDTYVSYVECLGTGSNQNTLEYITFDTLGDTTKQALELGRNTLDNDAGSVVFMYKCRTIDMNQIFQYSLECINSFEDQNVSLNLGGGVKVTTFNSVNPASDHTAGFNKVAFEVTNMRCFGGLDGLTLNAVAHVIINNFRANNCVYGIQLLDSNWKITDAKIDYCNQGIDLRRTSIGRIGRLSVSNNTVSDIQTPTADGYSPILTIDDTDSTLTVTRTKPSGEISITNYNNTVGLNKRFLPYITITSDTTLFRTTSPSFKATVELSDYVYGFTISNLARTFYATSGSAYSLDLYAYKDILSTGATAILRIAKGTDGHGLNETTEYNILPSTTTTWELKQLTLGTATSSGFVELELVVTKGALTWNLNIDDLTLIEV